METKAPRSFPSAHGRDFWLAAPASRERRILRGLPGATNLSLGLLSWDKRSSSPLFCPKPSAVAAPQIQHLLPRPPGSDSFAGAGRSRTGRWWRRGGAFKVAAIRLALTRGAAGLGAAERSGADRIGRRVVPVAPSGGAAARPRRSQETETSRGSEVPSWGTAAAMLQLPFEQPEKQINK